MIDTNSFAKLVPGFDFLQGLMQNAGQAVPAMGQWIAPTLNPEELEKRIGELKTVQFWLEQNARMIGVTIQALEVQRMTLSTLQTMNLPMAELRNAMTLPSTAAPAAAPATPAPAPQPAPEPAIRRRRCRGSPGQAGRGRPDAMVGRADEAVHRTGHQGRAGQQCPGHAQPGHAPSAGTRRTELEQEGHARHQARGDKSGAQAQLTRWRRARHAALRRRARHPSRLAHGAVARGRAGGRAAGCAQRCRTRRADARFRLFHRSLCGTGRGPAGRAAPALGGRGLGWLRGRGCGGQRRRVLRRAGAGADAGRRCRASASSSSPVRGRCHASMPSARWCMPTRAPPTWASCCWR